MTDIDPDAIGRLLLRVEADAHRRGWDQPAVLYVLYDARDSETDRVYRHLMGIRGPAIRVQPYAAQSAVPGYALDGNPAHALFRFALNIKGSDHPIVEAVVGMMRQPGFVGMAFLYEGYARSYGTREERDAEGDVLFADMPGSVEMRGVLAADIGGIDYLVARSRGEKPVLSRAGDFEEAGGSIIESLRVIVAKVADRPLPELVNKPTRWTWERETSRREDGEDAPT